MADAPPLSAPRLDAGSAEEVISREIWRYQIGEDVGWSYDAPPEGMGDLMRQTCEDQAVGVAARLRAIGLLPSPVSWPDWVIAACSVAYLLAISPMLLGWADRPGWAPSLATGACLLVQAGALRKLGAGWASSVCLALGLSWAWLAGQAAGVLP